MSESRLEKRVVEWAEADGWFVRKLQWIGQRGGQDRIFVKAGRVVFMELKDRGEPLQALQARNRRLMIEAGAECHMCDNFEDAIRILRADEPASHTRQNPQKSRSLRGAVRKALASP